jgi:hypothetical protein
VKLTPREAEELVLALGQSPDWLQSDETPGLWLWTRDDAQYAVLLVPTDILFEASVVHDGTPTQYAPAHFLATVREWTSYALREAHALALRRHAAQEAEPEELALLLALLPPEEHQSEHAPPTQTRATHAFRTFPIEDGGYVRVELQGDLVRCTLSLPTDRKNNAYGSPLVGILHASQGSTRDAAAAILLKEVPYVPVDPVQLLHPEQPSHESPEGGEDRDPPA